MDVFPIESNTVAASADPTLPVSLTWYTLMHSKLMKMRLGMRTQNKNAQYRFLPFKYRNLKKIIFKHITTMTNTI